MWRMCYDEYSYGNKNPQAVKELLREPRRHGGGRRRFLVLMGDASVDPRNYLGLDVVDYLPTKMWPRPIWQAPSDDWFADRDNDGIPELGVGRLPVRSAAEAASLVAKLAGYRKQPREADWRKRVLLVADENDTSDFEKASETVKKDLGRSGRSIRCTGDVWGRARRAGRCWPVSTAARIW